MRKLGKMESTWFIVFCLVSTGIGIGWLVGLSVSPVVSIVLTSVIGSSSAIIAALTGLSNQSRDTDELEQRVSRWYVSPVPLAALTIGILLGSVLGILVRNYQFLGTNLSGEVTKWTSLGIPEEQIVFGLLEENYPEMGYSTFYTKTLSAEIGYWTALGLSKDEVVRRMFDRQYLLEVNVDNSTQTNDNRLGSYLFSTSADECENLLSAVKRTKVLNDEQQIVNELISSTDVGLQQLPIIVTDTDILLEIVEKVLCANQ